MFYLIWSLKQKLCSMHDGSENSATLEQVSVSSCVPRIHPLPDCGLRGWPQSYNDCQRWGTFQAFTSPIIHCASGREVCMCHHCYVTCKHKIFMSCVVDMTSSSLLISLHPPIYWEQLDCLIALPQRLTLWLGSITGKFIQDIFSSTSFPMLI